jgi:hypothetical protein
MAISPGLQDEGADCRRLSDATDHITVLESREAYAREAGF